MEYFSIFLASFTIALSGALAPGPLLATVIYESSRQGFKSGPLLILGHALLEMLLVILLILGLSRLINNPPALKTIALAGSLILVYFGIRMIASLPGLALVAPDPARAPAPSKNLVFTGASVSIANPYWTIWWLSIGLGLVLAAQKKGMIAVGAFFLGHILADLGWYSCVSLAISKTQRFISQRAYKGLLCICALALIGFGIYFGASAFARGQ
ncbi:MAG TPA: LysE family transporter [Patescibacteria group bacterium]|nr:LysE family transporter [Patescibacteria group bacterium]